ncbi:MAG: hypothetical protein IJE44_00315 [Clostridia bacterium]|nr:hypothetical protein [Clostridia bacterium]
MNIEKMLSSLTPEQLEAGLLKLSGVLTHEQMAQVKNVLKTTSPDELSEKLKNVDVDKVKGSPEFSQFFKNNGQ